VASWVSPVARSDVFGFRVLSRAPLVEMRPLFRLYSEKAPLGRPRSEGSTCCQWATSDVPKPHGFEQDLERLGMLNRLVGRRSLAPLPLAPTFYGHSPA